MVIQCWVWCQGVVGRTGCGSGGWSVCRRVDGVGGVEVGVESHRVVGVALQGADAVVMRASQGVGDGVGEQRMRADLDEGARGSAPAAATAWLNRTGLRRLATQYSASKTAPRVVWSQVVEMNGMVGMLGVKSASAARNSGRIGSMIG